MNGWTNPFIPQLQPNQQYGMYQTPAPKYELTIVKGEEGAKAFRMAPYSKAVLVDETAPIVWFAQTDGAGYLTVTPYDITLHQTQPQVDINDLAERLKRLEENYVQQSNTSKPRKQQRQQPTEQQPAATTD